MDDHDIDLRVLDLTPAKRIQAVLPDDGTDRSLIKALRRHHGITRVATVSVRAVAALQDAMTRRGRLPESMLARLVTVIVSEQEANIVFDFIPDITANIGRPGGGMLMMDRLLGATPFEVPAGVVDETD